MATSLKNLSDYNPNLVPDGSNFKIGIAVAEWNTEITGELLTGCIKTLKNHNVHDDNIMVAYVPGTFELSFAAHSFLKETSVDAVIVLGCVIQGETRHFDFVCQGVTQGITELNIRNERPVIFGVLTTDNLQQAKDRAGGKHGNKGDEAAVTALKMIEVRKKMIGA